MKPKIVPNENRWSLQFVTLTQKICQKLIKEELVVILDLIDVIRSSDQSEQVKLSYVERQLKKLYSVI